MKNILILIIFFSVKSWSQTGDFISHLSQKFEANVNQNNQYRIHLFLNQNRFIPGDTALFKVYLYDKNLLPARGKMIFSLCLINPASQIEQRINFVIKDGVAHNQFVIPPSVKPGLCFLSVFNPSQKSDTLAFLHIKEITIVNRNKIAIQEMPSEEKISFFPEGGHLITGVANSVVVKSPFSGVHRIVNDQGAEIARFQGSSSGLTKTYFTPSIFDSYYTIEVENQTAKFQIENKQQDGCAMRVGFADQMANINLSVPLKSALKKQEAYLVVVSNKKIEFSSVVNFMDNGTFKVSLPLGNLPNGISQVTVFKNSGDIIAERSFYLNKPKCFLQTQLNNDSFWQRDKVEAEVKVTDLEGKPLLGDFVMTVKNNDFFNEGNRLSFSDEIFVNEIVGLNNPGPQPGQDSFPWLDNYLIAQNFKLISWPETLDRGNKKQINKTKFDAHLNIKGRAVYKNTGLPVPDSTLVTTYLLNTMTGYETYVTKDGAFNLNFLYDFFGEDELFYSMENKGKQLKDEYIIQLDLPSLPILKTTPFKTIDSIDLYTDYALKRNIVTQSFNFFDSKQNLGKKYEDSNFKFEDETMGTDFTVKIQDFVIFPTMHDLIREVVPFLEHRMIKGKPTVRLIIREINYNVRASGEPLYIIDGVLTKNTDFFLSLKPADIISIKLINQPNKLSKWGQLGKNGIVLVSTKKLMSNEVKKVTPYLKVTGITPPSENKSITNPNAKLRVPDLRSTLYWNPMINVGQSGKASVSFYTSDDIGTFKINVQGMTSSGEPCEAFKIFEVKYNQASKR